MSFGCENYHFPFLLSVFPEHATVLIFSLKILINSCSPKAQYLLCWRRFGGWYETHALTRGQTLICNFHSSPSFSTDWDVLWDMKMRAGKGELISWDVWWVRHTRNLDVYVGGWLLPARVTDLVGCLWIPQSLTLSWSLIHRWNHTCLSYCQEIESAMPLCKEQTPSLSPWQQRVLSGLGDSRLCSGVTSRAWTDFGGSYGHVPAGWTSLSLSSTHAWDPVVPRRLWAKLDTALHEKAVGWIPCRLRTQWG